MNVSRYIGLRVGSGIVVGARVVSPDVVEFRVLDDGEVTVHAVPTEGASR